MIDRFKQIGKDQWLEKIRKDLRGADPNEFFWIINDRIRIDPFLHSSDFGAYHSISGKKADLNMQPMQPGDVQSTWADVTALETAVGFRPDTPLDVGLGRFVDWYREHFAV